MFLEEILEILKKKSLSKAYSNQKNSYTYADLYQFICNLYQFLLELSSDKTPVIIYGHKEIYMKAAFLACSFAGIPYVPVDSSMPIERIDSIISQIKPKFILGDFLHSEIRSFSSKELFQIMNQKAFLDISKILLNPEDIYYIIFTSGSTGLPKGVKVSYKNLDSCMKWLKTILPTEKGIVLNQANFSFDLSIADLYFSLLTESEHFVLEKELQFDFSNLFTTLKTAQPTLAVMTPSFADFLLLDKLFQKDFLPHLKTFLFCGEKLLNSTVKKIFARFGEDITIINSYGPTECTFAVTSIPITPQMISLESLPIGIPKDDTKIFIVAENKQPVLEGQTGEILITGPSVTKGYCNVLSEKFFSYYGQTAYLTGDLGFMQDGILYFKGRNDSQIKFKGYRIELSDIENNLLQLDYIEKAIVIALSENSQKVSKLIAFVVLRDFSTKNSFEIKNDLLQKIPAYMCPIIKVIREIPLTENGKCDKQKLIEIYINR